ncbi:MAG TPA: DUF2157 domain-containing protein [Puia sp.]|jgi:hypothetical protein|nr:DUF2157 domain-containing protein [Puia sp.]
MNIPLFKRLHAEGLISGKALEQAEAHEGHRLFSLFRELRLLLYLGVLLLTGGLGIVVYKNIDTIGHQAILAFIALITSGSFYYCLRKKNGFSWEKVEAPNSFFDYILLLGCLSLLIFLGYWQYQYDIFGDNYGLATFIPMVILFASAYYFDHLGVLSLAVTNLAAWAGLSITPLTLIKENSFADPRLIFTGILLGSVLLASGRLSAQRRIKAHFETTYTNFGLHLFFVASLAGLFIYDTVFLLWFAVLAVIAFFMCVQGIRRRSFYFVLMIVLYTYIGLCYTVLRLLWKGLQGDTIAPGLLWLGLSAFGVAVLLIRLNRKIHSHDSL